VVAAVGERVDRFEEGDRVYAAGFLNPKGGFYAKYAAVDGRADDVPASSRRFAPGGLDAALLAAGGDVAEEVLSAVRRGGRVAYPNGIRPAPQGRSGVRVSGYNGDPDPEIIGRLDRLIESGPFEVHIARMFPLEEAADAHRALGDHYLGKLALRTR
jgi:NADPH:quinone reductase